MALQIISLKRKAGEYQGVKYDNYVIHCVNYDSTNQSLIFGPDTEDLKIKADTFAMELARNVASLNSPNVKRVEDIEGLIIVPIYNKFGACTGFNLDLGATSDPDNAAVTEPDKVTAAVSEKAAAKSK